MRASAESAVDVGRELALVLRRGGADQSTAIRELIGRLTRARSETAEDALALALWSGSMLREAVAQMPEDDELEDLRYVVAVGATLALRAVVGLEAVTGLPIATLSGEPGSAN